MGSPARSLAVLAATWPCAAPPAQAAPPAVAVPVAVLAPDWACAALRSVLDVELDGAVRLAAAPAGQLREAPAEPCVLLFADEWSLATLAAAGALVADAGLGAGLPDAARERAGRFALPFAVDCVVAGERAAAGDAFATAVAERRAFEELALRTDLHDALGIVGPEVDGSPWLLAMREALDAGRDEAFGFAVWTTLDARAGRLGADHGAVRDAVVAGTLRAALLPAPLARGIPPERLAALDVRPLGRARLGVAATAGAGERVRAVARRFAGDLAPRLAAACEVVPATGERPPLDAATAAAWRSRFESTVRGRGRATEQLADGLDFAFTVAFLIAVFVVWRVVRRRAPTP